MLGGEVSFFLCSKCVRIGEPGAAVEVGGVVTLLLVVTADVVTGTDGS